MPEATRNERKTFLTKGIGQLSLVEHALCPLDARAGLRGNLVFNTGYQYTGPDRRRCNATATVFSPLGLSPEDEYYLWGLLALTLQQPEPDAEFHATPHYCLRQLGVIDHHSRRGGRQYNYFTEVIERLSAVTYRNDRFYDPIRAEHRQVCFGFLSYSLPIHPESGRAWRFIWNPLFFEFVAAASGSFRFDLATYRDLDPASRRLFLFLSKVFSRRDTTPRLDLRQFGVNTLGFSANLSTPDLKIRVRRLIARLVAIGVVGTTEVRKESAGVYTLMLSRGPYFDSRPAAPAAPASASPLVDPLRSLGFDPPAIVRLIKKYPRPALREWIDITLAAKERFKPSFFKRSPQAYLVDNLKAIATGNRTPPDWWLDVRKAERASAESKLLSGLIHEPSQSWDSAVLEKDSMETFERVRRELFGEFTRAGDSPVVARGKAHRLALAHITRAPAKPEFARLGSLIRYPKNKQ